MVKKAMLELSTTWLIREKQEMEIQNGPEIFTKIDINKLDLFVHDFKMTDDVFKSKVNLSLNMFSFLQKKEKKNYYCGVRSPLW
ncbi:MAG: hypothetical protein ACI9P5_004559 [Saprospiraceae bacterium]|jgi:hypothetical protein